MLRGNVCPHAMAALRFLGAHIAGTKKRNKCRKHKTHAMAALRFPGAHIAGTEKGEKWYDH